MANTNPTSNRLCNKYNFSVGQTMLGQTVVPDIATRSVRCHGNVLRNARVEHGRLFDSALDRLSDNCGFEAVERTPRNDYDILLAHGPTFVLSDSERLLP